MTDEEIDNWYKAAKALQDFARDEGNLDLANAPLIDLVETMQSVHSDREFMKQVKRKFDFN